ncbi:hypothetical protein MRX96_029442 [Rhipicephalus microplus]
MYEFQISRPFFMRLLPACSIFCIRPFYIDGESTAKKERMPGRGRERRLGACCARLLAPPECGIFGGQKGTPRSHNTDYAVGHYIAASVLLKYALIVASFL